MSCHSPVSTPVVARCDIQTRTPLPARLRVLLVGGPNVGKSTLFNALTGARQHTSNAPGTTVELTNGNWRTTAQDKADTAIERALVDLPGTYSLLARSLDEQVTADAVQELAQSSGEVGQRGVVVVVLDTTALARSLYLLGQVAETGVPLVVALTMLDLAGTATDSPTATTRPQTLAAVLAASLGVPVVPVDSRRRAAGGLGALARAVDAVAKHPRRVAGILPPDTAVLDIAGELAHAERLFEWVAHVTAQVAMGLAPDGEPPAGSGQPPHRPVATFSDRVDTVLLNTWAGIPVFLAVVWLLFELTTRFAAPLQAYVSQLVNGPLSSVVTSALGLLGLGNSWVQGLLVDGVLVGVGTVLTFLPVMAVMFTALGVLEDCGYLARAAFVADRAMRSLGLDGRALLPLVIGFGCNLPGLAATRTLPHARQRLLTGLLIPLTSCSARLTVYVLLAGTFFPHHAGTVIFALYLTSVALVLGGGLVLRQTASETYTPSP
jgi:ferrous iron transport protein B